jgi:flagellar biosynthetic protein FliP
MTLTRSFRIGAPILALCALALLSGAGRDDNQGAKNADVPAAQQAPVPAGMASEVRAAISRSAPTVAIFALASLVPAAVLMVTAFVRISVVLTLLRQALGSSQIPGNQVIMALALLLTALVMKPQAEAVYQNAIEPFAAGRLGPNEAWDAGSRPIKLFMVAQIERTHHRHYLYELYDYAEPDRAGRPDPRYIEEFPLHIVAPAFLLSELATALTIGFVIFLPFLVVDLVVSAVLAAMGLVMLPPSLVALPLKLIVFVLADGWLLVAGMLIKSFA